MKLFKRARAALILWLIRRYSHYERLPVLTYGLDLVHRGDIAVLNWDGFSYIGEVEETSEATHRDTMAKAQHIVALRLYRRAK